MTTHSLRESPQDTLKDSLGIHGISAKYTHEEDDFGYRAITISFPGCVSEYIPLKMEKPHIPSITKTSRIPHEPLGLVFLCAFRSGQAFLIVKTKIVVWKISIGML